MKYISLFFILILSSSIFSQTYESEWKWYILDDFEKCDNWPVINGGLFKKEYYNSNPRLAIIPGASEKLTEQPKLNCLGVKILFIGNLPGSTEVFVVPLRPIEIPGICKKLSFWVNSRNKKLDIKLRVANYANYIYDLVPEPSTLDFLGWKELVIDNIDKKIPQLNPNRPDYKPIRILSFIISNSAKLTFFKEFYIYIDHLKAYCNEYIMSAYDGSAIKDKW
jgi:hypothetical protein